MVVTLFLLSILLGFITILALIIPKKILFFTAAPSRSKAILFLGLPAIILFAISMTITPTRLEIALEDPENVHQLSLSNKNINTVPSEVATLINLKELDLSNNQFTEFPAIVSKLTELTTLDLSENPITQIPSWVLSHPSLTEINLSNTAILEISDKFNKLLINYKNTPLWDIENREEKLTSDQPNDIQKSIKQTEDHSESFSEFALREILGNDYGFKRKFKKGEIYYKEPVTKAEADNVGKFFVGLNYFNDENEVSVLLNKDKKKTYILKMVVKEDQLDDKSIAAFRDIRKWINEDIFPKDKFHLHLIDTDMNLIKEFTEK